MKNSLYRAFRTTIAVVGCCFALGFGLSVGAVADAGMSGNNVYLAAVAKSLACNASNVIPIGGDTWEFNCSNQSLDSVGSVPIIIRAGAGVGGVPFTEQTIGAGGAFTESVGAGAFYRIQRQSDSVQVMNCGMTTPGPCDYPSGLSVGAGFTVSKILRGTVSWTPGSTPAGQCTTNSVTVTGAALNDPCYVTQPTGNSAKGVIPSCDCTGANTCEAYLCNMTAGAQVPTAGTYGAFVIK